MSALGGATLFPCYEGKVRDNRKIEYCVEVFT
jgi:hypothetical protein